MPGQATPPETSRPAPAQSNRLERAVALLLECVDLLRTEIDEARNDGPNQEGRDHGEHSTGDQPAG